ncbi:hypothetical protein PARMER_03723 [Parabacteroides merdae ATCC 43184]|nr:hypothetical protein PARMER_03723 [Parabacteroides merdae ATCC 43184]
MKQLFPPLQITRLFSAKNGYKIGKTGRFSLSGTVL